MSFDERWYKVVEKNFDNQRLDYWLKKQFPEASYALICKLTRKGIIRVNNHRANNTFIIKENDKIKIPKVLYSFEKTNKDNNFSESFKQKFQKLVVYKNDDFLILNKPAGLSVQGGTNIKLHVDTLLDFLKFKYDKRPKLVHRIDKDTSGLLIIARTLNSAQFLTDLFKYRKITKVYLAIVYGKFDKKEGEINLPVNMGIKKYECKTIYQVLHSAKKFSVLALKPITGRKHQLRSQLFQINKPILGDKKYFNQLLREKKDLKFEKILNLHAYFLSFIDRKGEKFFISVEPNQKMLKNFIKIDFNFNKNKITLLNDY